MLIKLSFNIVSKEPFKKFFNKMPIRSKAFNEEPPNACHLQDYCI